VAAAVTNTKLYSRNKRFVNVSVLKQVSNVMNFNFDILLFKTWTYKW
jgi:hypothetical protein